MEADLAMQLPRDEIGANLPEVIIKVHAPLPLFPEARPAGQIKVHPVDVGQRLFRQGFFDRRPVVCPRYYPDFVVLPHLLRPVPADTRLGASTWFTSVCGDKNSHSF